MTMMEDFYKTILDHLDEGVYLVAPSRRVTYWNSGAERITGYSAETMVSAFCSDNLLVHIDDCGNPLCTDGCPLVTAMETGQRLTTQVFLHHADGHRIPVLVRSSPIMDAQGRIIGAAEVFNDNSPMVAALGRIVSCIKARNLGATASPWGEGALLGFL